MMRWTRFSCGFAAAVLLLIGCGSATNTLSGSIRVSDSALNYQRALSFCKEATPDICSEDSIVLPLTDRDALSQVRKAFRNEYDGATCGAGWMGRAFSDVSQGADVVVRNGEDDIIASSSLGAGTYRTPGLMTDAYCEYAFTLDVTDTGFYQLVIGNRDAPLYSYEELVEQGWLVELSLSSR